MKCLLSGLGLIYLSYVFFTGSWGNFVYQPYKEYNEAMIGLSRDMDIDKFLKETAPAQKRLEWVENAIRKLQ